MVNPARTPRATPPPATADPEIAGELGEVLEPKPRTTKYTANLDEVTALAFDGLALNARRAKGRPVDKSELLRVLVLLAADDASLRDQAFALLPDRGRGRS